tara:strand:+ start:74 stop:460 length:387 start_codon:yes stop_codon:yes gene_type:complete
MFTLITVSLSLLFVTLTGWTIITYITKKNSQQVIKKEISNLFNISKMFFISLRSLIEILAKNSYPTESTETNTVKLNKLDDTQLSLVNPVKESDPESLKVSLEDDDTALSSFSPEVIEVIEEEEEKVA